jgi:hypothetical protein
MPFLHRAGNQRVMVTPRAKSWISAVINKTRRSKTMKNDKQGQPAKAKKLQLNKETLRDIRPGEKGKDVRGGAKPAQPAAAIRSFGMYGC